MSTLVSVILPTFNRSRSLPAAIQSVLSQSWDDLELIVVDDASTEDIAALVTATGDPRVRYVRRATNGGAGAARNTGLLEARGDLIAFQDSDDLWLPGKLQRQLDLLATLPRNVGAVTGGKLLYGRDSALVHGKGRVDYTPSLPGRLLPEQDQLKRLLRENRLSLQSSLFRRACYPERQWFDPRSGANEDWEFAVRLARHTKIYEDDHPVVVGFVSTDSISTDRRKQTLGVIRILKANRDILAGMAPERAALLIDVARCLAKTGKPRMAIRFLLAGIVCHPPSVGELAISLTRRFRSTAFRFA